MRAHLLVLFLCCFVVSCNNMPKPVMDIISDTVAPTEEPFGDVPRITVSDAAMQAKITGPWLWMIAPTDPGRGGQASIDTDSLAIASNGVVTEIDVATNGVAAGDMIGDLTWTLGTIAGTSTERYSDNINEVINRIGFAEGNLDDYSSYALINLVSETSRPNLTMRVGSDDAIKVWLNSEVVHNHTIVRGSTGFQDEFEVDLKAGSNLLMVKVHDNYIDWAMFVGIEDPSVIPATTVADMPIVPDDPSIYSQYDVNQDGNVDNTDLTLVSAAIGQKPPTNLRLDVNGNGVVDGTDVILVSKNFGRADTTAPQDPAVMQPTAPTAKLGITAITFENATNLIPGERYRFQPDGIARTNNKAGESTIPFISWSNVDFSTFVAITVPEGSPRIDARFDLEPRIYQFSVDGIPAISDPYDESTPWHERDQVVVEIIEKVDESKARNGDIRVKYTAVAIENLTHPNRKFEPVE